MAVHHARVVNDVQITRIEFEAELELRAFQHQTESAICIVIGLDEIRIKIKREGSWAVESHGNHFASRVQVNERHFGFQLAVFVKKKKPNTTIFQVIYILVIESMESQEKV